MPSKWRNRIPVIVFCGGLAAVFCFNLFTADRDFSEQENRMLAKMPAFSADALKSGEFTKGVEEYITDQFVGRDAWLGIKWYSDLTLGKKESNGIYIAGPNTLIPKLEGFEKTRLNANVAAVNTLAENIEQPLYFTLIPTAAQVWNEKLPYGAPNPDQEALITSIYDEISTKAETIDSLSPLFKNRDKAIFYRTDHHWSTLGAYYGYEHIMKEMGIEPMDLPLDETTGDAYADGFLRTVTTDFYGTSQAKSGARGISPDFIQIWESSLFQGVVYADKDGNGLRLSSMYSMDALRQKDKYKVFFDGNQPEIVIRNVTPQNNERLLIIKDSYANSMIPFMTGHFSEIYVLDMRFMKKSVSEYVKENEIDKVLVMYGLANFLTDPNIAIIK